mmetsp:Transcript_50009/g.106399  ORF Transcript_50009/g.106399 Transcript_50009/m.106399 type:complete len:273 (-) Transcript_50009:1527-2345(-)
MPFPPRTRRWMPSLSTHTRASSSTADFERRMEGEESERRNSTNDNGESAAEAELPSILVRPSPSSSSSFSPFAVSSFAIGSNQCCSSSFISLRLSTASSSLGSSSPSSMSRAMRLEIVPRSDSFVLPPMPLSLPSSASRIRWPNRAELRSSSGLMVGMIELASSPSSSSPSSPSSLLLLAASAASAATDFSTTPLTPASASSSTSANPQDKECASAAATVSCIPMVHFHGLIGAEYSPASSSLASGQRAPGSFPGDHCHCPCCSLLPCPAGP